jgi:hypothetical protein
MAISIVVAAAVAYLAGAFTPGVLRKVKALFVKEADAAKAKVEAEAQAVEKKL